MTPITRTVGFYLVILIALAQLSNGLRGLLDPLNFSAYFGVPASADPAWVRIYGLRSLLLGTLAAVLLWRREISALRWFSLLALPLPLGDLWLSHQAGAGTVILLRHAAVALVLVMTFTSLQRWLRRVGTERVNSN